MGSLPSKLRSLWRRDLTLLRGRPSLLEGSGAARLRPSSMSHSLSPVVPENPQQANIDHFKKAFSSARNAAEELNALLKSHNCPTKPLNLTVSALQSIEGLVQTLKPIHWSFHEGRSTANLEEAARLLSDIHSTVSGYSKKRLVKCIRTEQGTLWRVRACCEDVRGLLEAASKQADVDFPDAGPNVRVTDETTDESNATARIADELRFDRFDDIDEYEESALVKSCANEKPVRKTVASVLYGNVIGGETTELQIQIPVETFHCGAVVKCITVCTHLVYAGLEDGRVYVIDMARKEYLKHLNCFDDSVTAVAATRDEGRIVVGSAGGEGGVWSVLSGYRIAKFEGLRAAIRKIHVLSDQQSCGMEAANDKFAVWNFDNPRPVYEKEQAGCDVWIIVGRDGRPKLSGSYESTSNNFDESNGMRVVISGHSGANVEFMRKYGNYVSCMAWNRGPPDRIVYGCTDGKVLVTENNVEVCRLEREHESAVRCLALADGGSRIVTGSDDHTAIVWEVFDVGYLHAKLTGHSGPLTCVAASDDGMTILTGSKDCSMRIWKVPIDVSLGSLAKRRS